MRMRYVSKIQANLKRYQKISSKKTTGNMLDGSYRSIYKGNSLNFDELREYVPGDDIKNMDWKASARSHKLLVRQYVAEKKHNVMLVFDSNARMLADSKNLEEKRELAILGAGTLAYFVNRNGDEISATFATETSVNHIPFKSGLGHIETILENYHKSVTPNNQSDLNAALEYIVRHFKRKMILIIATDLQGLHTLSDVNLKRILVAHDVLLLHISDADLQEGKLYNLKESSYMSDFFLKDRKLIQRARERKLEMEAEALEKMKKYGIANVTLDDEEELDREMIDLLNKHKLEKR